MQPPAGSSLQVTDSLTPFPDDWSSALCVAAHPDDLEYGTASAVAAWTARRQDRQVRAGDLRRGRDRLPRPGRMRPASGRRRSGPAPPRSGSTEVEFLGYPDGVVEYGLPLRRDLAGSIRRHRARCWWSVTNPDLRPAWGGIDQADHRAVGLAGVDATRDAGNRWVFRDLIDEGLEPWKVRYTAIGQRRRGPRTPSTSPTPSTRGRLAARAPAVPGRSGRGRTGPRRRCCAGSPGRDGERFGGRLAVSYELLG